MTASQLRSITKREREAVEEFERRPRDDYPDATIEVKADGEPDGVYLMATINHEDTFDVLDHINDRLLEARADEVLPVFVIRRDPTIPSDSRLL